MDRWLVCARTDAAEQLADELRRVRPHADVHVTQNALALRAELAVSGERCSVLVAEPCDRVDAVNLAAAVARDGHARDVMLAVDGPSGSLLSRAGKAGISSVVDLKDGLSELAEPRLTAKRTLDERLPKVASGLHALNPTPDSLGASCPVLCFASGRGGVGKTTLVGLAAAVAAGWGLSVACLDLDLAFGNLFSLFGLSGPADLSELALYVANSSQALNLEDARQAAKQMGEGISLWGSCDLPEHAELVEPLLSDLIRHISCGHDLLLVDSSPAWTDACALAVQVCDRLVLVSDDTAGGAGSLARAAALSVRLGVTRSRVVRVANRCERHRDEEDYLLRARVGLETARFYHLPVHTDVAELAGMGRIADVAQDGSDLGAAAAHFLAQTLEELGALPDAPEALRALEWRERKGRSWPFGREVR